MARARHASKPKLRLTRRGWIVGAAILAGGVTTGVVVASGGTPPVATVPKVQVRALATTTSTIAPVTATSDTPTTTSPPTTVAPTTTTTQAPLDPLSENCQTGQCYAKAACQEWASVDPTIQQADQEGNASIDFRLQNKQVYINMITDATLAAQNDTTYQLLADKANAIDNDINNVNPGDQNSLDKVASASEAMGSKCSGLL